MSFSRQKSLELKTRWWTWKHSGEGRSGHHDVNTDVSVDVSEVVDTHMDVDVDVGAAATYRLKPICHPQYGAAKPQYFSFCDQDCAKQATNIGFHVGNARLFFILISASKFNLNLLVSSAPCYEIDDRRSIRSHIER